MKTKCLWDIIDKLRDELNIASDGITDLNNVLKDMQLESIEQIKDNKKLKAEIDKEKEFAIETSIENDKLKAEIDRLKMDNNKALIIHAKKFFDDNPKAKEVYCFLVDASGVSDDGWIADSHAVSSVNDNNMVARYKRVMYAQTIKE